MPDSIDRNQLLAAVERYVSARGVAVSGSTVASTVVDRFLANRAAPAAASVPPATCAIPAPKPPEPRVDIAPFVCEDDVRQAMRKNQKIYVGPKTILTPSARDLGAQYDILVMAGTAKSTTE